jgi:hypothetical protein
MKISKKTTRRLLIGGVLVLATSVPSFAIFGLGDVVFDPSSYAELVAQATTLYNQYNTIKNNIVHFSAKNAWKTTLTTLEHTNVKNLFGETNGMSTALNSNSPSASSTAWNSSKVAVNSTTTSYLSGQTAGNSAQLSQLAMIEASDSASPDCITAVGQYRAARSANATANSTLQSQQLDTTSATNSEVEQLNLLNASEVQKMTEMQTQGTLQTCVASQMMIANMQQRNAAAADLNTAAFIKQQQSSNPQDIGNGSNNWTTYLP